MFYFISKKQSLKKSLLLSLLITWANVLHSFSGKYLWLHSFISSAVMMLWTRVWLRTCSCFLFLTCNMHIGKDHARLFLLMSSPPGQPGGSRHPLDFSSVALRDFPISAITRGKHFREVLGHLYCGCLLFFLSFFLACLFFPSEVTCPLPWIGLLFHIPLFFGVHPLFFGVHQIEWSAFFPGGSLLRICKGKTAQQRQEGPGWGAVARPQPSPLGPCPWMPAAHLCCTRRRLFPL